MARTEPTERTTLTLTNRLGFHARAAMLWVQTVRRFTAAVRVGFQGQWVDGRSVLELITLGAPQGSLIEVEAEGGDARKLLAAVRELVERNFHEEQRS